MVRLKADSTAAIGGAAFRRPSLLSAVRSPLPQRLRRDHRRRLKKTLVDEVVLANRMLAS
jgi:hypothetical protein